MKKIDNSVCLSEFGEFIKEKRLSMGLTQNEVADMVGISQSWYCRVENAEREVDFTIALRICQALRLDLSDFTKRYL